MQQKTWNHCGKSQPSNSIYIYIYIYCSLHKTAQRMAERRSVIHPSSLFSPLILLLLSIICACHRSCKKKNLFRVVHRHGAVLLILRVRFGFNARRSRHYGSWISERRTGRSERERGGTRDRRRRQNKGTTNAQTCDDMWMNMFCADTSWDTLSHNVVCAQGWKCSRKSRVRVFCPHLPSVTVDRYQLYTKPTVKEIWTKIKKLWAHFQLRSDAYHHEELGDEGQYSHPVCWSTRALEK